MEVILAAKCGIAKNLVYLENFLYNKIPSTGSHEERSANGFVIHSKLGWNGLLPFTKPCIRVAPSSGVTRFFRNCFDSQFEKITVVFVHEEKSHYPMIFRVLAVR